MTKLTGSRSPVDKQSKRYTYHARPAGRDADGQEQWRGYCKEESGLTVIEPTEKAALRSIEAAHRDLIEDMRKWDQQ